MNHAKMTWRAVAICIVTMANAPGAFAQPLTVATFPEAYRAAEDKLYKKYVFNRKVQYRHAMVDFRVADDKIGAMSVSEDISGENASRSKYISKIIADGATEFIGDLTLENDAYTFQNGVGFGGYQLSNHRPRTGTNRSRTACLSGPCGYPLTYIGANGQSSIGQMLDAVESGPTARTHYTLLSVRDSKWDGVPVVEAKFSGQQGYIDTLYLDPANDLAFLGSESDGSHDFKTNGKSPIKLLSRVTYRPSSEGYPHPWKFETWNLMPDGTRVPQTYTEVIEYAKYAPTADDFDLEKQFGVKPPGSVTAVGAGRSWWWLYAIAVLVALLAVTLVVVACRRGAATLSR